MHHRMGLFTKMRRKVIKIVFERSREQHAMQRAHQNIATFLHQDDRSTASSLQDDEMFVTISTSAVSPLQAPHITACWTVVFLILSGSALIALFAPRLVAP